MARWTKVFPSYSTLYSYVQVDNWTAHADRCTFDLSGGITSPYYWNVGGISCEIGWWESGTYHSIDTDTVSYNQNGGDKVVFDSSEYFMRQAADRTIYLYHEAQASGTAYAESTAYTVPHLAPSVTWASSNPVVRNSDNSITLKWNAPALGYSAMCLEVSTDGGSWSQFAVLWNTATTYTWNGASADHSYKFRIRTNYLASYSAYDTCATVIVNTPLPPQSITTAAAGGTTVDVTLTNPSPVATKVQYEVSTDGGATWGATQDSNNLTSFQTTITGTGKLRVRNYNATGVSAWLESGTITTITPPAAPTLTAPAGTIIDLAAGSVDFEWTFNSLDGSAQTAYEFSLSKNGGAATVTSGTTAKKVTQSLSSFSAGDTITIKVRTKGADANWGAWSATKTYNVYTAPTVSITSPSATVTGMPIALTATYSDMAGFSCVYAHVSLTQNGRTLFDEDATISGSSISSSLDVSEFLPTNGESYTVVLEVRSSSSLQSSANATFLADFTEPVEGTLQVDNDPETGYASLLATFDNTGADEPAVSISVARVNADGTLTPLITDGDSGAGAVDRYAPLNTTYQYAVTTKSSAEAVNTVYVDNIIETDLWFAYWGENVASAKWNPDNGGLQLSRPQKTRVYYAGRKDPVSYDGAAVALSETPSWMLVDRSEVQPFVQLIEDGGRGVYKSCDGWVYHADFDLTLTPKYTAIGYYGGVQLSVTRIAGEQL